MLPGFDTAPEIPYHLVREWLTTLKRRAFDRLWLSKHADVIARVLSAALTRGEFMAEATEVLVTIAPYMLSHAEVGRWLELLTAALGGAYDMHDARIQGRLYTLMGQAHTLRGTVKPARTLYELAIEHARENIDDPLLAAEITLISTIGLLRTQTFRYSDDFKPEMVAEVCALAKRIDQHALTAHLYHALASVYAHRGETALALGYGMTALGYWLTRGNDLEIGKAAHTLAIAYSRAELLAQAEQAVLAAYEHVNKTNNREYMATVCFQRGIIASQQQRWMEAGQWLESAYAQFCALGLQIQVALVCRSLALTYIPQRRFQEAELKLEHAALIWEREGNEYEQASVAATLGYLEGERGSSAAALDRYTRALALCKGIPEMKSRERLRQSIFADIEHYSGQPYREN